MALLFRNLTLADEIVRSALSSEPSGLPGSTKQGRAGCRGLALVTP